MLGDSSHLYLHQVPSCTIHSNLQILYMHHQQIGCCIEFQSLSCSMYLQDISQLAGFTGQILMLLISNLGMEQHTLQNPFAVDSLTINPIKNHSIPSLTTNQFRTITNKKHWISIASWFLVHSCIHHMQAIRPHKEILHTTPNLPKTSLPGHLLPPTLCNFQSGPCTKVGVNFTQDTFSKRNLIQPSWSLGIYKPLTI